MTVSIYLGDWRDVFESWPSPCVLICDPPYGIDYVSGWHEGWSRVDDGTTRQLADRVVGDQNTGERDAAMSLIPWSAAAVFGPSVLKLLALPPWGSPRDVLTLDKGEGAGMGDLSWPWKPCDETIAIYGDGWAGRRTSRIIRGTVISFVRSSASNGRVHPNEKSLAVCRELVSKSPRLPVVDPFMGSGVVGSACMLEGRDYFGAEIDPAHFAVASDRIGVSNGPLFAGVDA